ncbi:MAG: hypothetical protein ACE5I1_31485, partial [bacterium]
MKTDLYRPAAILFFLLFAIPFPTALGQEKSSAYGNTPDEMLPYKRFQKPYKLFFTEPQAFLGPGREKTAPPGLDEVKIGFLGPLEGSDEQALGL